MRGSGRAGALVKACATSLFLGQALLVALDGSGGLALALGGRLFVELTGTEFSDDTSFLARTLEAADGNLEGLVFFNAY